MPALLCVKQLEAEWHPVSMHWLDQSFDICPPKLGCMVLHEYSTAGASNPAYTMENLSEL